MTTRWHDDDAFWLTREAFMFGPDRFALASSEVEQILAMMQLVPPTRVLDLCCGPGRHSMELARRGFAVTGVDRTASYLSAARRRAREQGAEAEFVEADMRQFRRENAFDAAINLFTSFGYFEDPAEDRRVLENLFASLRPGGKLVMDLMGKEILARRFTRRDWQEHEGVLMLAERELQQAWGWIKVREIYIGPDGRRREFDMSHRLYSGVELTGLLESVGFRDVQIFGSLLQAPYDQNASRLVALATKP